jgi:hypothetical protein
MTKPNRGSEPKVPTCQWVLKGGFKCGDYAKHMLGHPEEDPVPICSLHFSRASTLGWPVRKMTDAELAKKTD